jgi:hypothetical protein
MPAFAAYNLLATSALHRTPLSISDVESQGLTALIIFGSQLRKSSAATPLLGPDQLMKISMVPAVYHRTKL